MTARLGDCETRQKTGNNVTVTFHSVCKMCLTPGKMQMFLLMNPPICTQKTLISNYGLTMNQPKDYGEMSDLKFPGWALLLVAKDVIKQQVVTPGALIHYFTCS